MFIVVALSKVGYRMLAGLASSLLKELNVGG